MAADLFTVSALFLERLTALGVELPRVLERAQLAPSRFREPKIRLSTSEFMAFWRALEELGSPDLALRLATTARPHQHDVASMAALHSPTLGDALLKKARYKRITCPQEIQVKVRAGEAHVRFIWKNADGAAPNALIDATFASLLSLIQRGTGTAMVPKRVELVRKSADPALARHFGCKIRCGAPVDAIVFDESALSTPFVTHNADLVAIMTVGLEAALEERSRLQPATLDDDVRLALRRHMTGDRPSVDKIADELHVSARTMQRRLGELGTSYQVLLDEVRRASARELLTTADLDISEVAFLLGYEEVNSFARAFQQWEGKSPQRWRTRDGLDT